MHVPQHFSMLRLPHLHVRFPLFSLFNFFILFIYGSDMERFYGVQQLFVEK
jgi:hypothetical protein